MGAPGFDVIIKHVIVSNRSVAHHDMVIWNLDILLSILQSQLFILMVECQK